MTNRRRAGSIKKQQIPESAIPKQEKPIKYNKEFTFSSIYHNWIKTTNKFYKSNNFTNKLKDAEEFSANITEITTEVIPKLFNEYKELFNQGNKNYHCHIIDKEEKELVRKIAESIHATNFNDEKLNQARIQWWYLGFKQNLRLIGLYDRKRKIFYPMFIDHHHLIYDNEFYNQPDFARYDFCPVVEYTTKKR